MAVIRLSTLMFFLLAVSCAALSGCGDSGPQRYRISGTVTHEGEPVPIGTVMFEPDASQGNSGASGAAAIKDGKFDSAEDGIGFVGGPHRITIQAFDGKNPDPEFTPYGSPLDDGDLYVESFDLPEEDVTLDIELTERKDSGGSE